MPIFVSQASNQFNPYGLFSVSSNEVGKMRWIWRPYVGHEPKASQPKKAKELFEQVAKHYDL